jgi:hypothetical protein
MNRIVFTFLAASLALINFAAAQDDERPAPVDRHNVARRQAPPQPAARSMPPQAQRSAPSGFQQPNVRAQQNNGFSPRFDAGVRNQTRFGGNRFNVDTTRPRTYQPPVPTVNTGANTNVAIPAATPAATNPTRDWRSGGTRDWRSGGTSTNDWRRGGTSTTDWRNRDNTTNPDQNLSNGAGRHGDWRNRGGTQNGSSNYNGTNWGGGDGHWRHDRNHHHRDWWRSRYNRFALFGGGYYYFNSGYWYPAYGYDPYFSTYTYDAPIYGYNDQDPGQVMADVQGELARRGYYYGAIDGTYGPQTRTALLRFQRESGLAATGIIDQPTLESLGLQ